MEKGTEGGREVKWGEGGEVWWRSIPDHLFPICNVLRNIATHYMALSVLWLHQEQAENPPWCDSNLLSDRVPQRGPNGQGNTSCFCYAETDLQWRCPTTFWHLFYVFLLNQACLWRGQRGPLFSCPLSKSKIWFDLYSCSCCPLFQCHISDNLNFLSLS